MDDSKFKEKLTQVCEWVYPMITDTGQQERLGLHRRNHKLEWEPNESVGPRVIKIYPSELKEQCAWCGKVEICHKVHKAQLLPNGKKLWTHTCKTCNKIWDPLTKTVKSPPRAQKK